MVTIDNTSQIKYGIHTGLMKSSQLKKNDILIAIVGATIGKVGLYSYDDEANINQAIAAVRLKEGVLPEFVVAYLLSDIGQTYLEYLKRPVARANINLQEIAEIGIPVLSLEQQIKFIQLFNENKETKKHKLQQADELLAGMNNYILDTLSIAPIKFDSRLCCKVKMSDLISDKTFSAEYYHPERMTAISNMRDACGSNVRKLIDIVDFRRDIVSCNESSMQYLGLAGVESQTGELSGIDEEAAGQAFKYEIGDVLYGRLRPYLNKVIRVEEPGICSTEFHVMRVKDQSVILPEYVAAIMRSDLILSQTKHMMTGNTHPRISNEDVQNLYVPVPNISLQEEITQELKERRTKARQLKQEAEQEWAASKAQFEKELLGE